MSKSLDEFETKQDGEESLTEQWSVRSAIRADVPKIADLLLEGFSDEYGGMLRRSSGRRIIERMYLLPRHLDGMVVAVDEHDQPIGVAGLRTQQLQMRVDWNEERIVMEELGVFATILLELRSVLTEPMPYQIRRDEAYIYSVTVTSAWRGRGVADDLLEYLHVEGRRLGKRVAVLEVAEDNQPALRLYERHGYTLMKRRRSLFTLLGVGSPARLLLCKVL